MSVAYNYIAIEGNIGAGKTSLVSLLGQRLGMRMLFETFENNPFLGEFYRTGGNNAFSLEMFFLAERFRQMHAMGLGINHATPEPLVSDYCIAKSAIFARFNLQEVEWGLFKQFYDITSMQVRQPDMMVYLHRPIQGLQHNIQQRGRGYEAWITDQYLQKVAEGYKKYFEQERQFPIIMVDLGQENFYVGEWVNLLIGSILTKTWQPGLHRVDL